MTRRRKLPPGIYPTANGKFEVRYREGNRQRSQTFDLADDAIDFKINVRRSRQRGEQLIRRKDVPTFGDASIAFLERREVLGRATKTLETNAYYLDRLINPYLGHLPTIDVTIDVLEDWQAAAQNDGFSAYLINRARELIGAVMKYAIRRRWAHSNPVEVLEVLPHKAQRGQPASVEQVEIMREYFIRNDRLGYATLISVLAYQGTRPAEALALTWDHVKGKHLLTEHHLADGEIIEDTKTHEDRLVPIPGPVVADLAEWRLASGRADGLIFPRADGLAWRNHDYRNWSRRWFKRAAAEAGLLELVEDVGPDRHEPLFKGRFRPYDLRHTCASLKLRAGIPAPTVAEEMGHSIETLFRTYSHDIKAMRDQPVTPIDVAIASVRRPDVREKFGRRAS